MFSGLDVTIYSTVVNGWNSMVSYFSNDWIAFMKFAIYFGLGGQMVAGAIGMAWKESSDKKAEKKAMKRRF